MSDKERLCWLCETEPLEFKGYLSINEQSLHSTNDLVRWWNSDDIKLICCHCFQLIRQLRESPNALFKLLEWSQNGRIERLKQLGVLCPEDLRELERLRRKND